jgi:hypothetical protein
MISNQMIWRWAAGPVIRDLTFLKRSAFAKHFLFLAAVSDKLHKTSQQFNFFLHSPRSQISYSRGAQFLGWLVSSLGQIGDY